MRSLLAHLVGDYVVQNEWMASTKTRTPIPAVVHGATYAACFLPLTRDPRALLVIGGTHAVIDRYRLAKYVVWARNQVAPAEYRYPLRKAGPFGQRGREDAESVLRTLEHRMMTDDHGHNKAEVIAVFLGAGRPVDDHDRYQAVVDDHQNLLREITNAAPRVYENDWLHGWLLYLCDNAMHLLINEWALARWAR